MKIQKKLGAAVLSLGLVVGLSGFAGATTGTIDTTGPDSVNKIHSESSQRVDIDNDNDLSVRNDNSQKAWSGEAEVEDNTTGGDATSGDASNMNSFDADVSVDNSGSVGAAMAAGAGGAGDNSASIDNTGPDSYNTVTFENRSNVDIDNDNDLYVSNHNYQTASTGDATVEHNTTGGDATTGSASNENTTTVRFDVTN